jgi:hypothetical protein
MELIEEVSLLSLMVTTILDMSKFPSNIYTWENIVQHNVQPSNEYNVDDCCIALKLSLMTTSNNYRGVPLNPPSFFEQTNLVYYNCPLPFKAGEVRDVNTKPTILGHLLYDTRINTIFIVFTGTINACMVGLDLSHIQMEIGGILNYYPSMRGHRGIYTAYLSIRDQLIKTLKRYLHMKPKIVITGHSLGGGLSQFCSLDLAFYNPIHYSFASPLVFNDLAAFAFNKFVKFSYRIANLSDVVIFSPLPVMPNGDIFLHVGTEILFQRNLGKLPLNHSAAYAQEYGIQYTTTNSPKPTF